MKRIKKMLLGILKSITNQPVQMEPTNEFEEIKGMLKVAAAAIICNTIAIILVMFIIIYKC